MGVGVRTPLRLAVASSSTPPPPHACDVPPICTVEAWWQITEEQLACMAAVPLELCAAPHEKTQVLRPWRQQHIVLVEKGRKVHACAAEPKVRYQ